MFASLGSLFETKTILKKCVNQQELEQRNAIIHKCPESLGHEFKKVPLKKPTSCAQCREMIGGITGEKCELCNFSSHIKCLSYINSRCVKASSTPQANYHQFKKSTFLKPTCCDHCGSFIWGVKDQGKECLLKEGGCGMKLHDDCEQLVCRPCTSRNVIDDSLDETNEYVNDLERDNWSKISIDNFDLIRILGVGGFSKVYLAKLKTNQQEYAIKVLKKTNQSVSSDPSSAFTEMKVLNYGRQFPFLTIVHSCFQSRDRLFFVMEYVQGKCLYHYIDKHKFTERRTRFHAAEIALALIFLHGKKIVYRDLKSDNVILEPSGHIKLLDFGMSKDLDKLSGDTTRTFCGTPGYISPEAIDGYPYGTSVDWWAFGVLVYEMLVGIKPYASKNEEVYRSSVTNDKVNYPKTLSDNARNLLEDLLTKDPKTRLGCRILGDQDAEILDHPFFANKEEKDQWWKNIRDKKLELPFTLEEFDECVDGFDDTEPYLTPSESSELIHQTDFIGFSFYSKSFATSAGI